MVALMLCAPEVLLSTRSVAIGLNANTNGTRQPIRDQRIRTRTRQVDLILLISNVLDRHKSTDARDDLTLHVRIEHREWVEPRTLQRRRLPLVTPDARPRSEFAGGVRAANRLLR